MSVHFSLHPGPNATWPSGYPGHTEGGLWGNPFPRTFLREHPSLRKEEFPGKRPAAEYAEPFAPTAWHRKDFLEK